MADAVLLDFYGTVVHEDDVVIDQICTMISRSARVQATPRDISRHWSSVFADGCDQSHGDDFQTQRDIELASIAHTIEHFGGSSEIGGCDVEELAVPLFECWERPPIFDDAVQFLTAVDLPVVVLSNIDRYDIEAAIDHHSLVFERVITSEDVRSYKPRPELFVAGLDAVGCPPHRVLHIGDSLTSDVAGALRLGIPVAWVNRGGRPSPENDPPTYEVSDLGDLPQLM